ncbi:MAG: hypothetical protein KKI12_01440 [Proteobacteria bacterium]|nr:hypothetical protein [Pseudomonadota bacterium]MCG2756854.1 hypothetical protein [Desulfobacteraceae bacterium]MCG2831279.1 hypothetical protein [Desulfobacteraceae bacterium]
MKIAERREIAMEFTKLKSSDTEPSSTFNKRRELWLLVYASNSCKLVRDLCNEAISGACQEGDSTYTGIINAIYVVYARSYYWCRSIGKLTEDDLPPGSKCLHIEMLRFRDKLYAHKDLDAVQEESEIFNTVRAVVIDGRITMVSNELLPRGPKLQSIMEHVEKLEEHFNTRVRALLQEIRRPGWPSDGEYILNMDAMSDEVFKAVPEAYATASVNKLAEPVISPER